MTVALASSSRYLCVNPGCREPQAHGFDVCPACGMQGSCVPFIGRGGDDADAEGDPCPSLDEYEEAHVERLRVCEPWNAVLGGGLPISDEGTSALVYGPEGQGKTSLLMQLAASVKGAVWVPCEDGMGPSMVKSYAQRLKLSPFRVVEPGSLEEMCTDLAARQRTLVVLDSLSADCFSNPIRAWRAFRDACPGAAFFAILHENKGGHMTGPAKLGHLCDIKIRVGQRIACHQKNRHGLPASAPNPWYVRGRKPGAGED